MSHQAESGSADEASLDVLVESERQLEQQLEKARQQAADRVQQARVAAQQRLDRGRQRLAAEAARRLAEGQQAIDELVARERRTKEEELARTWTGFEAFREVLTARMLAEVLGR